MAQIFTGVSSASPALGTAHLVRRRRDASLSPSWWSRPLVAGCWRPFRSLSSRPVCRYRCRAAAAASLRRALDTWASRRDRPRHDPQGHRALFASVEPPPPGRLDGGGGPAAQPGRGSGPRRPGCAPGGWLPGRTARAAAPAPVGLGRCGVAAGPRRHRAGGGDGRTRQAGAAAGGACPAAEPDPGPPWRGAWPIGSRRFAARRPAVPRSRPGPTAGGVLRTERRARQPHRAGPTVRAPDTQAHGQTLHRLCGEPVAAPSPA
jgi:hypothetical protein